MARASREAVLRKALGYALIGAGGLAVILSLPLWLWLVATGICLAGIGWYVAGGRR